MITEETKSVIGRAKAIYETRKDELINENLNRFVAIEPESGEIFVADTFDEAVKAAQHAHPGRLSHTIRIGHGAAFHIGLMVR